MQLPPSLILLINLFSTHTEIKILFRGLRKLLKQFGGLFYVCLIEHISQRMRRIDALPWKCPSKVQSILCHIQTHIKMVVSRSSSGMNY